jgi:hypothetical protein
MRSEGGSVLIGVDIGAAGTTPALRRASKETNSASRVKRRFQHWQLEEKLEACLVGIERGVLRCGNNRAFLMMNVKGVLQNMRGVEVGEGDEGAEVYDEESVVEESLGGNIVREEGEEREEGGEGEGEGGKEEGYRGGGGSGGDGGDGDTQRAREKRVQDSLSEQEKEAAQDQRVQDAFEAKMAAKTKADIEAKIFGNGDGGGVG